LVEKAYAKAHGCYRNLTGGLVAEGLHDLTGAPTETIVRPAVASTTDPDVAGELWVHLVWFCEAGFVMGLATSTGGDRLVGRHAYSVLDVAEVRNSIVAEQYKLTDYFDMKPTKLRAIVEPSTLDVEGMTSSLGESSPGNRREEREVPFEWFGSGIVGSERVEGGLDC
jgi:hypothetical protein